MPLHIDYNDPRYADYAAEILRRHDNAEPEANITSAVRDFLTATRLAAPTEIVEESPPAQGSRRAVDLTALDTFIEFKIRIGTTGGLDPNPDYVQQLDDYLAQSEKQGRVRMGILTDGRHWLLRWPNAGPVKLTPPYVFTLEDADRWITLYEWLRDNALSAEENTEPSRAAIADRFGPNSPSYQRDISTLKALYDKFAGESTIQVKRQLWQNLLTAALGEIASDPDRLDDLFVRHTYLTAVIGMVVQESFGSDIYRLAETDPADLLHGRDFRSKTGLQGVVESDFFAWPVEVGGLPLLRTLARRVARFDWQQAPNDVAAILYETVIPPDERRQLGEYYTPGWLARAMVREVVTDPLSQSVLDPACGSGTFVAVAVTHLIEAAKDTSLDPKQVLERLRFSVAGIDVHPVAVHLARAAWVLAAQPAIQAAVDYGFAANITVPIYLGDALQLRFRTGDMFAQHDVTVQVDDDKNTELVFPVRLVERAETFDALMGDIAEAIERDDDPHLALDDHAITDPDDRQTLKSTIATMQGLHSEGRNHIWAYYTRNLVRPVALSRSKVDIIIGNPPWLNYNKTVSTLREELVRQSKEIYGIWTGGRYATHQEVAELFFARSVDLYLKDGGVIGMVMPHSALQAGQYTKWRTGEWQAKSSGRGKKRTQGRVLAVNFGHKKAWDLERLEPNTFFPVPASVVFARRVGEGDGATATPLAGHVDRWLGKAGAANMRRVPTGITDTSVGGGSPYAGHSGQGAVIVPRCLFFVTETENQAIIQAGQTVTVNPRRGSQDKEPWKSLNLAAISEHTVEAAHVFNVHLGETVVPYATLDPLQAALPLRRGQYEMPTSERGVGGVRLGGLSQRMRDRWQIVSRLWEDNKTAANKLNLSGQLDYYGKLSSQLDWQQNPGERPVRVVYNSSGQPTAALTPDGESIVDYTLFWIDCKDMQEGYYLLAIINSTSLYDAVSPFMAKGQFGARHLQKHLWKLPIPEFDPTNPVHTAISKAGEAAAGAAASKLTQLHEERDRVTVTIARRELRKWLRTSPEGQTVEDAVGKLLGE